MMTDGELGQTSWSVLVKKPHALVPGRGCLNLDTSENSALGSDSIL